MLVALRPIGCQLSGSFAGGFPANNSIRYWGPQPHSLRSPNGVLNLNADSLGRGIGVNSPTNYLKYDIWRLDPNDMRNSPFNIKREFYYNNPADREYFGRKVNVRKGPDGRLFIARINGTLTSTVQLFRPTGANVALPAPTASSTVL